MNPAHAVDVLKLISVEAEPVKSILDRAVSCAISALEKQIPKKPYKGRSGHLECASCGWIVERFCDDLMLYPFCPNCGQALDLRKGKPKEGN